MCTTLIVPGLNGSDEGHWQRHWLLDDPAAQLVDQDDWQCPVLGDWLGRLETALASVDSAYVVAHSLGCVLVANMASRPAAAKIRGALLVAPAHLDRVEAMHPCIVRFGVFPLAPLAFPSLVVGSVNDPYMSPEELAHTAASWGSDLVNLGPAGHINIAAGFGRWPEGYDLLARLKAGAGSQSPTARSRIRGLPVVRGAHLQGDASAL
ncbi:MULTISPECIES: alpha/beta hydrolase [unclassified Agrobacterium]|uniref:alpha/beta hydrolase n=1 Tax=unclassified Agrobacterium TaxID=2632611 RepID=UPI00069C86EF|nr:MULTISPECIES: alpha/beta hydrolase [unclassified Agrobacterium]KNY33831.1 esterase [Agrobacterium sp. SUL3]MCD4663153.1 alpha/beta hydrolase [Agrobacterium sp.]